jgi:hypothetical protein
LQPSETWGGKNEAGISYMPQALVLEMKKAAVMRPFDVI